MRIKVDFKKQTKDVDIKQWLEDYKPSTDIFNDDDEKVHRIKEIVFDVLSETDRRILILYAEMQSMRDVAKKLNVSASTVYLKIQEIRKIVTDNL